MIWDFEGIQWQEEAKLHFRIAPAQRDMSFPDDSCFFMFLRKYFVFNNPRDIYRPVIRLDYCKLWHKTTFTLTVYTAIRDLTSSSVSTFLISWCRKNNLWHILSVLYDNLKVFMVTRKNNICNLIKSCLSNLQWVRLMSRNDICWKLKVLVIAVDSVYFRLVCP